MPCPCEPCSVCVHGLNCFPAVTFIVADGFSAASDTIILAVDVEAVGITSSKNNRKGGFRKSESGIIWER